MDDLDSLKKARNRALRYLTYRPRTISELKKYLIGKQFAPQIVDLVVGEMVEYGYLNDESYTEDFINYRKARGFGSKRIRYELMLKGIDREIIEEKIAAKNSSDEDRQAMRELVERRLPADKITDERWVARQAAFLQRRGYANNLIFEILRDFQVIED